MKEDKEAATLSQSRDVNDRAHTIRKLIEDSEERVYDFLREYSPRPTAAQPTEKPMKRKNKNAQI